MAQAALGRVVLKRTAPQSKVTVRPLSSGGVPGKPVALKAVPGGLEVPLEKGKTFVYEVTFR
jgi:hypothetical protein